MDDDLQKAIHLSLQTAQSESGASAGSDRCRAPATNPALMGMINTESSKSGKKTWYLQGIWYRKCQFMFIPESAKRCATTESKCQNRVQKQ